MPADILRDAQPDAPPAPPLMPPGSGVVAPQFADLADATVTTDLAKNRAETDQVRRAQVEAADRQREALVRSNESEKEANKGILAAINAPVGVEAPGPANIQPPPSRHLTDFLAPVAGESPENTITKLIQGIGLMASGIVGLKRGDATAALAGLHGALSGWQAGDKERADRAYADWDASTKAMLLDWQNRHQAYRDALENHDLSVQQAVQVAKLKALENGHDAAVAAFDSGQLDKSLAWLDQDRKELRHMEEQAARLREQYQWKQMQFDAQQQMRVATIAHWDAQLKDREEARAAAAENRKLVKDSKDDQPAHGKFYDYATGKVRQISAGQWKENNEAINTGGQQKFQPLSEQQVATIERLSIAPTIYNRLDQLIDKIQATAPGENITQGLINKLKQKSGISSDIAEFTAIQTDAAVELAAALSGGQPRISILAMIRGEAQPGLSMTADAAHRMVQTGRVTIRNRLTSTTGDPKAYDKMSADFVPYGEGAAPALPAGWSIKEKK